LFSERYADGLGSESERKVIMSRAAAVVRKLNRARQKWQGNVYKPVERVELLHLIAGEHAVKAAWWTLRHKEIQGVALGGQTEALGAASEEELARAQVSAPKYLGMRVERSVLLKARVKEQCVQADILRDIFGLLPFRQPAASPSWQGLRGGTIPRIAQAIYNEHRFAALPVLADALEDEGCTDADLLTHCRQPGEHVRGCWVIDFLLGKL
jgi:hypothetical protein